MSAVAAAALSAVAMAAAGRAIALRSTGQAVARALPAKADADSTWIPTAPRIVSSIRRRPAFVGAGVGVVAGAATAGVPGAIAGVGGGLALVVALGRRRRASHRAAIEQQIADAVAAIAAGLRAGRSLPQAIEFASEEVSPPLGPVLAQVVDRTRMGVTLDHVLADWRDKIGGRDARLVVGVLSMHRRSGGDLPTVLDRLATTLRERRAADRELRSLTAQARLSGAILGLLPIGFFGFLAVTARSDLQAALEAPAGRAAILAGFGLQGAAFVWIRRLLRVER